jgi:hypothetical protein
MDFLTHYAAAPFFFAGRFDAVFFFEAAAVFFLAGALFGEALSVASMSFDAA